MQIRRRQFFGLAGAAAAVPLLLQRVSALDYPMRPVRIIVAFAPGGPTDIFGRIAAQKLSERLGRQFYVENVGGAGGNIGAAQAARAAPDGYTILFTVSALLQIRRSWAKLPMVRSGISDRSRFRSLRRSRSLYILRCRRGPSMNSLRWSWPIPERTPTPRGAPARSPISPSRGSVCRSVLTSCTFPSPGRVRRSPPSSRVTLRSE